MPLNTYGSVSVSSNPGAGLINGTVNDVSTGPDPAFLIFYSDVVDGQMWCPYCRNVESTVKDTFDGEGKPEASVYWVGKREQWKGNAEHEARTKWNVQTVPTILRLQDGKETGRLGGGAILDTEQWCQFVKSQWQECNANACSADTT